LDYENLLMRKPLICNKLHYLSLAVMNYWCSKKFFENDTGKSELTAAKQSNL